MELSFVKLHNNYYLYIYCEISAKIVLSSAFFFRWCTLCLLIFDFYCIWLFSLSVYFHYFYFQLNFFLLYYIVLSLFCFFCSFLFYYFIQSSCFVKLRCSHNLYSDLGPLSLFIMIKVFYYCFLRKTL